MTSNKVSVHNFTVWEFISQLDAEQSMKWEFTPLLIAMILEHVDMQWSWQTNEIVYKADLGGIMAKQQFQMKYQYTNL